MRSTAGGVRPRPRECLNASLRRARTLRLRSPRCQAILGASEDLPLKSRIYAPTLKAMKVTSDVRSELERELFGADAAPVASPPDLRTLTSVLRATKTWREARDVIAAAERVSGGPDATLMSAALTALPKLARKLPIGPDGERQQLQNAAVDLVRRHLHRVIDDLDAAELTGVTVGLAKLGCGDAVVFQELARGSVAHMQSGAMTGTMLSNLAWAMATAGVRPCGAWLSEFWMELEDQVDALSSQDIANIFWSICRLELTPPWVVHPGPAPILKAALERVGLSSSGQDPATVLVCLAIWSRSYSYHPPEEQLTGMLAAMQKHLPSYLPQDLVSVVHSLVVLNANPSRAWMTDFYMVLREHLVTDQAKSLPMADFQRLLWALSRIDFVPSQAWLKQFVEVSIVKLRHLRFRALSELVWALACWGYTPTREWLDEYFRCTLNKLQEYKTQHLAISILALKKLGCKVPSPWLDAALTSFCAQLDASRAHDLITFIDGIVDVCDDASWMSRPATATRLRALASYAASKFDICDCVMHAKLLIALATAKCCPGPAWLSAQQDSFGRSLAGEEPGALDLATAGEVRAAYAAWDVPLSSSLGAALGDISGGHGGNGAVGADG